MKIYDAIVIGGGPAGVTASLYLARSGCSVLMLEKLSPGGQVLNTEFIENYPGFPKGIKGYELSDIFSAHLEGLPVDIVSARVIRMESSPSAQKVLADNGEWYEGRVVVLCSGSSHKQLDLPMENEFAGKGVSYCALCDGHFFRDQPVVVVGGGNSALEESLYLSRVVGKIYLVHRREGFRASKVYQDKIFAMPDKIEVLRGTVIDALHGEKELCGVTVRNLQTGATRRLDVTGLFVFVGSNPNGDFFPEGLNRDESGFIITDTEMRTNLPGVFAAGDIRSKLCRQISTAVGDGATAAQAAFVHLENFNV